MNNTSFESYLAEGCGRCDQFQTPNCKVHLWTDSLVALRALALGAGLVEAMKWGMPTYTHEGKNVAMVIAFRDHAALSFFKGTLVPDPTGLLETAGENSKSAMQVRFRSAAEVHARADALRALLAAAIEVERAGLKVDFNANREPVPEELQAALDATPGAQAAFDALTPGRQRSHILQVSGAKQVATRRARAEKCLEKILLGKGFLDR